MDNLISSIESDLLEFRRTLQYINQTIMSDGDVVRFLREMDTELSYSKIRQKISILNLVKGVKQELDDNSMSNSQMAADVEQLASHIFALLYEK